MILTSRIQVDMLHPETAIQVDAVQDDRYTRRLELSLLAGGEAFSVPDDVSVLVEYQKPDGHGGSYDTLPDGTPAWTITEHLVTVALAPQVCTAAGVVQLAVSLVQEEKQLTTFPILLRVQPRPGTFARSEDYNWVRGYLPQPLQPARAGQFLQVAGVDGDGFVREVRAVDDAGTGGTGGTDGFSPVVEVTAIEGGHRISITDAGGTQSFDVMDGTNGTAGENVLTAHRATVMDLNEAPNDAVSIFAPTVSQNSPVSENVSANDIGWSIKTRLTQPNGLTMDVQIAVYTNCGEMYARIAVSGNWQSWVQLSGGSGTTGENGKSAYELYVQNGGLLSESEWLASLSAGTPGYAESLEWLEANGDPSKMYLLPDGKLYAHGLVSLPAYTDLLTAETAVLNAYRWGGKINEELKTNNGYVHLNFGQMAISNDAENPTIIRIRPFTPNTWTDACENICVYNPTEYNLSFSAVLNDADKYTDENGDLCIKIGWKNGAQTTFGSERIVCLSFHLNNNGIAITDEDIRDIIVTVDEPIVDVNAEHWFDTGIKYANYALTEADAKRIASVSSPLSGKKVLVLGDSISTDYYGSYKKWVTNLIDEGFMPSDVTNDSIHATGFVARTGGEANDFLTRIQAVENKEAYDLVIIFGGINDAIQNIPMGGESGQTDTAVYFKPAVDWFFDYVTTQFVNARILVFSPLRTNATWKNSAGHYQTEYAEYIRAAAKSWCLPVLNLTEESGFYPFKDEFRNRWTLYPGESASGDGVHPNAEYCKTCLAPMIRAFLNNNAG